VLTEEKLLDGRGRRRKDGRKQRGEEGMEGRRTKEGKSGKKGESNGMTYTSIFLGKEKIGCHISCKSKNRWPRHTLAVNLKEYLAPSSLPLSSLLPQHLLTNK
jgi:hypothetical protein